MDKQDWIMVVALAALFLGFTVMAYKTDAKAQEEIENIKSKINVTEQRLKDLERVK